MAVVTIARLSGSGGDEIASRVAERVGYDLVDSALIAKIAEHAGVNMEDVLGLDERSDSKAIEWLKNVIMPRIGKIILDEEHRLEPEGYFQHLKLVIHGLAEKGNIVIVGRGSQFILKDLDDAFHVRVIADQMTRVKSLRQYYAISEAEALDRIKHSDAMKSNFIQRYFHGDWEDSLMYHLVVNTSHLDIEESSEIIVRAVRLFSDLRDYIPGVRDRRKGERRKIDRRRGDRRASLSLWTHRDLDTALLKGGRPIRTHGRPDRRHAERRKKGRRGSDPPPE